MFDPRTHKRWELKMFGSTSLQTHMRSDLDLKNSTPTGHSVSRILI